MNTTSHSGEVGTRCERCGAVLLEHGVCPACLLRDGLGSVEPSESSSSPVADIAPRNGKQLRAVPGEFPSVDGFEVLAELGHGGMGVVYLAEQTRPVRRRVALKLVKLGMDTRQVIARFEAERQALALMDHPNVAKVLGAGTSVGGRPYFVMELVRGLRITDYCDQYQLSTRERLELFLQVCRAIQHAHQKGIIHRDVKPSNILVTQEDGRAVPKVIDFGIAKATGGQWLTDKTLVTGVGQFLGTPAYTSPEQAEGGVDIDTRTDIYSLGVLLYELLTGKTPFDSNELLRAGWDVMRSTIRQTEPQRPSTRLTTLAPDELMRIAKRRRTEPPKLVHAVRGDLDWIIMKCLEKDRARRYESCSGIAYDIHGHLHHEPVRARPPSAMYKVRKFLRRHRLKVSVVTLMALTLLAACAVASWSVAKGKEANEAKEEAGKAKEEADKAKDFWLAGHVKRTMLPPNKPVEVPASESALPAEPIPVSVPATWKSSVQMLNRRPQLAPRSQGQSPEQGQEADEEAVSALGEVSRGQPAAVGPESPTLGGSESQSGGAVAPRGPLGSASTPGASYPQLAAAWWSWMMGLPLTNSAGAVHPVFDTPFIDASEGQSGGVWFLATPFGSVTRRCVIPPDTWLFLGLVNVESSSLEGGTMFFGGTAAEQADIAGYFADHISGMFFEIDGVRVQDMGPYRVQSPQISFTAPTPWIFGMSGGTGTSVGDGYFMLISPLGPGEHTIHYGGAFEFRKPPDLFDAFLPLEMTYLLTVP